MTGTLDEHRMSILKGHLARGEPLIENEPTTLPELFRQAIIKNNLPDALNSRRGAEWNSISSNEMISRIENIACGLIALGFRQGDKAAILATNSPEWTLSDAGCQFAGIIDVPIYTTLAPSSVKYILSDSGAKVLFLENKAEYDRIADVVGECGSIEKLIFFNPAAIDLPNAISLMELEAVGDKTKIERRELLSELAKRIKPEDIATLIYTSGTTGEPKGVMLTHANILSNVIDAGEKYDFSTHDIALSVLPLTHVFERSAMYLYIFNGMSVFYAESIDKVPDNLREVRPTIFIGVPRIFEKVYAKAKLKAAQAGGIKEKIFDWSIEVAKEFALAKERREEPSFFLSVKHKIADVLVFAKLREFFGGRLRACITGGAALPDEIFLIFTGAGIAIMQGYGLTETSPVLTSSNPSEVKLGTVGRPIRNTRIRIAQDGEVEATGPGVMLGYYNKPDATRDTFTEDGWFKTGDIGEIDGDGFLRITDRKKELFKTSGGKYIAPSPIEQMIRSSRFVSQAVLIGNDRKFAAALVVPNFEMLESYVQLKSINARTPAELCRNDRIIDLIERQIDSATQALSRFEKVKKIALLENELTVAGGELTPTLKIKRRVVEEKYKDVIDRLYADNN
ncbi:MAG: long-chain fatty acid--CoA ligase [Pyrinomonadaceae bacterium]